MKRLIAAGSGDIFQISRSFRNGDSGSPVHNPEFRLLEWYAVGASYLDCIPITEELVRHLLAHARDLPIPEALSPPFSRMTMEEAFRRYTDVELADCQDSASLVKEGARLGLAMPRDPSWEEAFHIIFLSLVEPSLPRDKPLVLLDYPALIPTTARKKRETPYAERWELFMNGVEIANCYSEETDPGEIKEFLRGEEDRKKKCLVRHPTDEGFAALFDAPFPSCAGVALGVDRLEMALGGEASLEGVILFPFSATLGKQSSTGLKGST
jgi:lysyl-tRNA synthetase class 2